MPRLRLSFQTRSSPDADVLTKYQVYYTPAETDLEKKKGTRNVETELPKFVWTLTRLLRAVNQNEIWLPINGR